MTEQIYLQYMKERGRTVYFECQATEGLRVD